MLHNILIIHNLPICSMQHKTNQQLYISFLTINWTMHINVRGQCIGTVLGHKVLPNIVTNKKIIFTSVNILTSNYLEEKTITLYNAWIIKLICVNVYWAEAFWAPTVHICRIAMTSQWIKPRFLLVHKTQCIVTLLLLYCKTPKYICNILSPTVTFHLEKCVRPSK